jgi:predicted alpha/beta hydrolase family esterase
VPFGLCVAFGMKLASRLVIRKGAGHFNEESGYTQFPRLLADIIEILDANTPETI